MSTRKEETTSWIGQINPNIAIVAVIVIVLMVFMLYMFGGKPIQRTRRLGQPNSPGGIASGAPEWYGPGGVPRNVSMGSAPAPGTR